MQIVKEYLSCLVGFVSIELFITLGLGIIIGFCIDRVKRVKEGETKKESEKCNLMQTENTEDKNGAENLSVGNVTTTGYADVQPARKTDLDRALQRNKKKETDRKRYSPHFDETYEESTEENAFFKLSGLVWSATEEDI